MESPGTCIWRAKQSPIQPSDVELALISEDSGPVTSASLTWPKAVSETCKSLHISAVTFLLLGYHYVSCTVSTELPCAGFTISGSDLRGLAPPVTWSPADFSPPPCMPRHRLRSHVMSHGTGVYPPSHMLVETVPCSVPACLSGRST